MSKSDKIILSILAVLIVFAIGSSIICGSLNGTYTAENPDGSKIEVSFATESVQLIVRFPKEMTEAATLQLGDLKVEGTAENNRIRYTGTYQRRFSDLTLDLRSGEETVKLPAVYGKDFITIGSVTLPLTGTPQSMFSKMNGLLKNYGALFVQGLGTTLLLALIAVSFGCIFGAIIAIMRLSSSKVANTFALIYTEVIRDTPLLLQLYFFYFLLPDILPQLKLSAFTCITIALVFNSTAYMSEVFRSGIQSIDRGQTEAARSLGLSAGQTMTRIILPQAFKNILPALCNEFVAITKETSLGSTFYVGGLMTQYQTISGKTYMVLEPLIIIGIIYFVVTFAMSKGVAALERRLKADD